MKVRVKRRGSGRPAITIQTSPQTTLRSLRSSEMYEFSLNGKDALKDTLTLVELGIVNGDLLYVLPRRDRPPVARERVAEDVIGEAASPVDKASLTLCHQQPTKNPSSANYHDSMTQNSTETVQNHSAGDSITPTPTSTPKELSTDKTESHMSSRVTKTCSHFDELRRHVSATLRAEEYGNNLRPTPTSILCNAVNSLMLDSGYYHLKRAEEHRDSNSAKWSYGTVVCEEVKVHLACVKMGPQLSVHGMAAGLQEDKSVSLTLTISSYVSPGPSELLRTTELAQLFKDRIAHKLLTDIRTMLGLPEVGTFSSLFPEIKLMVCRKLDVHSLLSLSSVNKELYILCQDPYLWKHFLIRDFDKAGIDLKDFLSWKQLYIDQYNKALIERRMRERAFNRVFVHPFPPFPPTPLSPLYPLIPSSSPAGIIGGDYDRLPHGRAPDPVLAGHRALMRRSHDDHVTPPLIHEPHHRLTTRPRMCGRPPFM